MTNQQSNGMDVGVFQPVADMDTGDPAVVAKRAEELGFASYWVPEHALVPEGSCDDYPGKQLDEPPPDYLFKMPDPFIATGEYVEHHGRSFDFPRSVCKPTPVHRPHPPVLLGSISNLRVFRRIVRWADGWLPFTADPKEIADGKAAIAEYAEDSGRDPAELRITLFSPEGLFRSSQDLEAECVSTQTIA